MQYVRIDPEHLLLGILTSDRAVVQQFLSRDASEVFEKELRQKAGKGPVRIADHVDLPLSTGTKNVFTLAAESARAASHPQIDTSDLVFGLIREENTLASRILREYRGTE